MSGRRLAKLLLRGFIQENRAANFAKAPLAKEGRVLDGHPREGEDPTINLSYLFVFADHITIGADNSRNGNAMIMRSMPEYERTSHRVLGQRTM